MHIGDCEDLWIEIINPKGKNTLLGVVYRHPNQNQVKPFKEKFEETIFTISSLRQNYFIFGDFNLDLSNGNNTNYVNSLYSLGCKQIVDKVTHPNPVNDSLLDHIYTNCTDITTSVEVLQVHITDHFPIILSINDPNLNNSKVLYSIEKRDLKNFKEEDFANDTKQAMETFLSQIVALSPSSQSSDVDDLFRTFLLILNEKVNAHAPLKKINRKDIKHIKKPWITKAILKSYKIKNQLYRTKRKTNLELDIIRYKIYSNKLNHIKEAAKVSYYSNLISKSANNIKKTWKNINEILNLKPGKHKPVESIKDENGKIVFDPESVGNVLNNFFSDIGTKLGQSCKPTSQSATSHIQYHNHNFYLKPVIRQEIEKIIDSRDTNKGVGPDDIPIRFIKMAKKAISPVLEILINLCFEQGKFPQILKSATILPIYKSGDSQEPNNHRPISLTSPFSKIIEKCILKQLDVFLTKFDILHPNQFGFRKNLSTEMAISKINDEIVNAIEDKLYTCSVFLDIRKAFDSVDHTILINKLEKYGVRGLPLKLIKSFISERVQSVIIKSTRSNERKVNCGVPQGSVLGPVLFLCYINDLPLLSELNSSLFADDACLSLSDKSLKTLELRINNELLKISNWLNVNKLKLNAKKTVYMLFTKKHASIILKWL